MSIVRQLNVQEIPQCPADTVRILRQGYSVSPTEYSLLLDCQRDDITKFALDGFQCSAVKRLALRDLQERGYVFFNPKTGKWELKPLGQVVVETAPGLIQNLSPRPKEGMLIAFPSKSTE